ncbi:MAG: hypothetical protein HYT42_00550 [Candidatus Sungbacteria bacterium]|nr:hypothetical protein [Candidatus Sungbacteria bacterium]
MNYINSASKAKWWLIILAVVLVGLGWYYYSLTYRQGGAPAAGEDASTKALETQSSSDETEAIEQDLGSTDLEGLDAELSDIDSELR